MSAPDLDALYSQAVDEAVAQSEDEQFHAFMRRHFPGSVAVAPASEPQQATVGPAPQQAPPTMPVLHQGVRGTASADDGAMVDAYVRTYFPQTRTP